MSVDAVAVLNVPIAELRARLPAPQFPGMPPPHLVARGDATLFHTFVRFDATVEELGAALRLLGPGLELHAQPRGVLVFPDTSEPSASSYGALVTELAGGSFWLSLPLPPAPDPAAMLAEIQRLTEQMRAAQSDPAAAAALQAELAAGASRPAGERPGLELMRRAASPEAVAEKLRGGGIELSDAAKALLERLKK